jgi:hypothetical protein
VPKGTCSSLWSGLQANLEKRRKSCLICGAEFVQNLVRSASADIYILELALVGISDGLTSQSLDWLAATIQTSQALRWATILRMLWPQAFRKAKPHLRWRVSGSIWTCCQFWRQAAPCACDQDVGRLNTMATADYSQIGTLVRRYLYLFERLFQSVGVVGLLATPRMPTTKPSSNVVATLTLQPNS